MPAPPNPCLQAAIDYAARGWPIVPIHWPNGETCSCGNPKCQSPAKHPLTLHGLKDASKDKSVIQAWWKKWPQANLAIITGAESGLVVLDVDAKNGGLESLKRMTTKEGNLPYTPTVYTGGGGEHYLMAHPRNGTKYRNRAALGGYGGIDVRGDGGYIIAAPSRHISGKKYTWKINHIGADLRPIPEWLSKLMLGAEAKKTPPPGAVKDKGFFTALWGGVGEGQRNDTAARLAGRLLGRGMQNEEALALMRLWNSQNSPPMPEQELAQVIWSITRSEEAKPTTVGFLSAADLLDTELERTAQIIGGGILLAGGGMLLTGESGAGKSILSLEIAIRLSKGMDLWDLKVEKEQRILIIQKENTPQSVQTRLRRQAYGLQVGKLDNIILADRQFTADMLQVRDRRRILDIIEKTRPTVIILDPLISYHQANENDNVQMRRVMDVFTDLSRESGVAWIIVHHEGKPSGERARDTKWRFRGATSIRDWADTMMGLTIKTHEAKPLRLINFDKVRHGAGRPSILVERTEQFLHVVHEEDSLVPMSLIAEILSEMGRACVGKAPLAKAIEQATGCSRRTAYNAIDQAIGRILFEDGNKLILLTKM